MSIQIITSPTEVNIDKQTAALALGVAALAILATAAVITAKLRPRIR